MSRAIRVAIVDDEADMRQSISQWLALSGFATDTFADGAEALGAIGSDYPGIVITDIRMPGTDGMALLKRLVALDGALPVIMITGHGDVPVAVEAMRLGAFDFLEKPFDPEQMMALAERAAKARAQALEARALRAELADGTTMMQRLVGASDAMQRLREDILDIGQADGHVLIDGETGTGKTLVAQALHAVGSRAARPLVSLDCAGLDGATLAARLFGPPAADSADRPLAEQARGGTLVLEDVESLPDDVQARLVAHLNAQGTPPETRVIAVCNTHAPGQTIADALRPELFYRLGAHHLVMPPLRARGEDILALFRAYLDRFAEEYGCTRPELSVSDTAQLLQAPWPGNVRQLITIAERTVLQSRRADGALMSLIMADNEAAGDMLTTEGKPLKEHVELFERILIDNTMRRHKGAIATVMEELGLPRRTLNEKMAKYGLVRADYV